MRKYHWLLWPLSILIAAAVSAILVSAASAQDSAPPGSNSDATGTVVCVPVVVNSYGDGSTTGVISSNTSVTWGDFGQDGNSGDQMITTVTQILLPPGEDVPTDFGLPFAGGGSNTTQTQVLANTPGGQVIQITNSTVIEAVWSTTCQQNETCTNPPTTEPCPDGMGGSTCAPTPCAPGDTSPSCSPTPCPGGMPPGPGGSGCAPTPCPDMSGGGNGPPCAPTPCPNGSGGMTGTTGCGSTTIINWGGWTPNPTLDEAPACEGIIVSEDGVACYPNCKAATVDGGVACLNVLREPYPRALVSVPNVFTVTGPWNNDGNVGACVDPEGEFPLHKNRTLQVVWRMRREIPPAWFFDERPWNISNGVSNQATGYTVEHTFETASFPTFEGDKPSIGPSLTSELLPAYLVRVDTWWSGFIVREWDQYEWYQEWEDYDCNYSDKDAAGNPRDPNCRSENRGSRPKGPPVYRFAGHRREEDALDLRAYGWPTANLFSRHAWDSRQSTIGIPSQYICRYVPVPVIESQAILVNP